MSKELDYLDKILNYQPLTLVERTIIECIKEKIQRLEAIDNANPSEALKRLEELRSNLDEIYDDTLNTIEIALLKAKQEHNSLNLLMQELDCKDFAELRKYARCGYQTFRNAKGANYDNIIIDEAQEPKQYVDELKLAEKKLKALEIIKEKRIDIESFYTSFIEGDYDYGFYERRYGTYGKYCLTEEEFNTLKAVLE